MLSVSGCDAGQRRVFGGDHLLADESLCRGHLGHVHVLEK